MLTTPTPPHRTISVNETHSNETHTLEPTFGGSVANCAATAVQNVAREGDKKMLPGRGI